MGGAELNLGGEGCGDLRQGEVEDGFCDEVVAVAEDVAFVEEASGERFDAEGTDTVEVSDDGSLAFACVLRKGFGADGRSIDERVVEDLGAGVVENLFDVLGGGEAEGFVGLSHEVANVDAGGVAFGEGLRDAPDKEIGDERGVEGAGAEGDEVGGGDGVESLGEWAGVGGGKDEFEDGATGGGDVRFAANDGAVVHAGGEGGVGGGGGIDAAAGGENLGAGLDGLSEVAGDAGEGG